MPELITDAAVVSELRTIASELTMRMTEGPRADLLRLADLVEARIEQRDAAFEAVERRVGTVPLSALTGPVSALAEHRPEPVPLGSLAEHRRSVEEEAKRLLDEAQAVEARYRGGIGDADWEG